MLERVSYHAVLRFLERVLDCDVAAWLASGSADGPEAEAQLCCERAGVSVDDVRTAILSPGVRVALSMASPDPNSVITVLSDDHAFIVRNAVVVTVTTKDMHRRSRGCLQRLKVSTVREGKRGSQRANRRNRKRGPAVDC